MSSITARFVVDGHPRPPDANSVTYSLYGQSGELLVEDAAVVTGPTAVQVQIVTPAQTDERELRFEKRTMIVRWTVGGVPFQQRITYRLTAFLNHTITAEQVRSYLGVKERDLADSEIDVIGAYIEAETLLTAELLDITLAQGGIEERRANDVILYLAVLRVIPSLKLRVAQEEREGSIGLVRPQIRDFSELQATTETRLAEALQLVNASAVIDTPTLIVASLPTDVITGA